MAEFIATIEQALPPPQAIHIDQVCDRFESEWKVAGPGAPPPRIEEFLLGTPEPERTELLHQMVLLEIDYRRLREENPTPEEYAKRFPGLSSQILAEAFPAASPAQPLELEVTVVNPPVSPHSTSRRYVARQFHARGGIGEVWLAEDVEIGRQVALKRLRKKLEGQQERFLVEAQITGQLEHPAIVPVHDMGVDEEGRPFYVMTFIRGRTLTDVIQEYHSGQPRKESLEVLHCRLLEFFIKVCEAVGYAHNRGVIHRDLKPDNVMLGPYGETLVLDWGMAKVRSQAERPGSSPPVQLTYTSGSTKTQAGSIMGSPFYMAPEMAEGRSVEANERTDVYLLGGTLYHILTGRPPREGRSLDEIVELARHVNPTPPRKLKPDVPRTLEAICCKAMARKPEDRYTAALEMAEDVKCYLAGAPVAAFPEPVWTRALRWCKRHRRGLGKSLLAASVLVAALVVTLQLRADLAHEANLRRAAQAREEQLQREADEFRRREQVDADLAEFRRLADERQFYAANTTHTGDRVLPYDSRRGQEAGEKALAMADCVRAELKELSLTDKEAAFRKQLHDLLLLMVLSQCEQAPRPETIQTMLQQLELAVSLQNPSRGYYHLRARCYHLLGDTRQRDEEARRGEDPQLTATALDHFLLAEEARTQAMTPMTGEGDPSNWQPNTAQLTRAIEHYEAALRIERDHYWCYFQLGRCYLSLGKGTDAVDALGRCVLLQPRSPWGYSARGLALGLIRRYADGEKDLAIALELQPDFRPALLNRGILAWLQGSRTDEALAHFAKVLAAPAEKKLIEAAYYRGLLFAEQRRFREAMTEFDNVVREAPGFRYVYLSRAQLYFLQDDPRGIADLTTYLELQRPDSKEHVLFALRGRLLRELVPSWGLTKEQRTAALRLAHEQLSRAIQLGDRSAEVFHDLGSVLELQRQPARALEAYAQALAASPPRELEAKVLSKRGWIYAAFLQPPQVDKAQDEFNALLRLKPQSADAHAGLGYLAVLRKSPTEAQSEAFQALLHGRGDYLALHNLACIYAELSQVEKDQEKKHQQVAIALLRRAIELWRRGGVGPNEIELIRREPSFASLRHLDEFKKLLED